MKVLSKGSNAGTIAQPAELKFFLTPTGDQPGAQEVVVYNVSNAPLSFQARASTVQPGQTVLVLPPAGVIQPETPFRLTIVHLNPSAQTGNATITLQLSDGNVVVVRSQSNRTQAASPAVSRASGQPVATSQCGPTRLLPSVLSIGQGNPAVGWPTAIALDVRDDCGLSLTSGTVIATFSNGDPPAAFQSLGDGRWHSTWSSRGGNGKEVSVRFEAKNSANTLLGQHEVRTGLLGSQAPPLLAAKAIVNPMQPRTFDPVAVGSWIEIPGERLAESALTVSDGKRWPLSLGTTRALIGGKPLALRQTSTGQILGMTPFDLEPNTGHHLVVLRGLAVSTPIQVDVAAAQPALLDNPEAGNNWAWIRVRRGDKQFVASPSAPVLQADEITLLATGLGEVTPKLEAGVPAGPGHLVASKVAIVLNGSESVDSLSAMLAPGMVGVYEISARISPGKDRIGSGAISIVSQGRTSPDRLVVWGGE